MAQVNLVSNAAGAGTAGGLTATGLVEFAAQAGVANIQLKDGQTGTKYMAGRWQRAKLTSAAHRITLPFLMGRGAGSIRQAGQGKGC